MQIIPTRFEPLSPGETARELFRVFSLPGRPAPGALVRILCALIWHETNGHPPGYGIGNVSAAGFINGIEVSRWTGLAWRPPWFSEPDENSSERNRTLHAEMMAGHEPSAFRAFSSLAEGLQNWRDLMARRFPTMLEAAARGDLSGFARQYRDSGYCGNCEPGASEAAFRRRLVELDQLGAFRDIPSQGPIMGGGGGLAAVAGVLVVVGAVAAWITRRVG